MSGALLGLSLGLLVGGAVGATGMRWHLRERLCPDRDAHELSEDDRSQIAEQFKEHARAAQEQVSTFADALADGDVQLRERLRLFEAGGQ